MPWQIFLVAVAVAAFAGLFAGKLLGPPAGRHAVGQPAADFAATTVDGRELRLSGLRGKVVVVDFWASWCGPCIRDLPSVVAAHQRFAGREDLLMIGVSLDDDRGDLEAAVAAHGIGWPQVLDAEMPTPVAEVYGVRAIPFAIVIGKDGNVFASDVAGEDLAAVIEKALGAV